MRCRSGRRSRSARGSATLKTVEPVAGPNWTALEGTLAVSYRGGARRLQSTPQSRNSGPRRSRPTKSALLTRWNGQLYAVLGDETEGGTLAAAAVVEALRQLIWYGGVLIGLGGLLALIGRRCSDLKRRGAQARIARRRLTAADDELRDAASRIRWTLWLPLALFALFCVLVASRLLRPARAILSQRDDRQANAGISTCRRRARTGPGFPPADLRDGKPICSTSLPAGACPVPAEAPQLAELERAGRR